MFVYKFIPLFFSPIKSGPVKLALPLTGFGSSWNCVSSLFHFKQSLLSSLFKDSWHIFYCLVPRTSVPSLFLRLRNRAELESESSALSAFSDLLLSSPSDLRLENSACFTLLLLPNRT